MKCLITGATGFLGKRVLDLLIDDPEVKEIHIVSRRKLSHPSEKVTTHCGNLIQPWESFGLSEKLPYVDKIIHIAGLYDFNQSYTESYSHNVLPALNLVDFARSMKRKRPPEILYASTYAVASGLVLEEEPLTSLPSSSLSYPYTKALAEQILVRSGLPLQVFRLGVLVGDSETGDIEKIDGPYYLMRFLSQLSQTRFSNVVRRLPIPASPETVLPLVPVDAAARVFHKALHFKPDTLHPEPRFYGVYRPESIKVRTLVEAAFEECFPSCKPVFLRGLKIHSTLFKLQHKATQIPADAFTFATRSPVLKVDRFRDVFGENAIPHFNEYRDPFFNGFKHLLRGGVAC